MKNLKFLIVGIVFGIVFVKAEIVSWFRIQEMFLLHSYFMFGVIATAVIVAALSIYAIKKLKINAFNSQPITLQDKTLNSVQPIGGLIFELGWALIVTSPGLLFAQIGSGFGMVNIILLSAIAGI